MPTALVGMLGDTHVLLSTAERKATQFFAKLR